MLATLLLAATPSPTPTPKIPNADLVTPGVWGFVITLLIAVATILLIWDMMRRVRRARYRAEVNAKLDAEEAQRGTDIVRSEGETPGGTDAARRPDRD